MTLGHPIQNHSNLQAIELGELAPLDANALATVCGGVSRNSAKPNRANQQHTQQLLATVTGSIKDLVWNSQNNRTSQLLQMMMMMVSRR